MHDRTFRFLTLAVCVAASACSFIEDLADGTGDTGATSATNGPGGGPGGGGPGGGGPGGGGQTTGECEPADLQTCDGEGLLGRAVATDPIPDSGWLVELAAADLDQDGRTDLMAATTEGFVQVLMSRGDGTFALTTEADAPITGEGLATGDFDGDCIVDMIVSHTDSPGYNLDVYSGRGDGTFGLAKSTEVTVGQIVRLAVAEFNGDGQLDVLFAGNGGDGGPAIALGNGDGTFGSTLEVDVQWQFTAADVTGDGIADIVSAQEEVEGSILCTFANSGNAQFAEPVCQPMSDNTRPEFVAVGDLNGDDAGDVVVLSTDLGQEEDRAVNVFLNNGDGTFQDRVAYGLPHTSSSDPQLVDVDNDGDRDIAAYGSYAEAVLYVLKNEGGGTFAETPERYAFGSLSNSSVEALAVGDFLGNGLQGFAAFERNENAVSVISNDCR